MKKTKEEKLEYFSEKYTSGIIHQIRSLNKDIFENNINENTYIDIIAIIKENGFDYLTTMLKNYGNDYSKNSFELFMKNLIKASFEYDKFNKLIDCNEEFKDFIDSESKKIIKQEFKDFVNQILKLDQQFNINNLDILIKNFEIDYKLDKKDIKDHWNKNTYYYLKSDSDYEQCNAFYIHNLKNNSEKLIESFEKLSNKDNKIKELSNAIELLNHTIDRNHEKINKIDNIVDILFKIEKSITNKIDLLKAKALQNEETYEFFKEANCSESKDILEEAKNLKDEKNKEIIDNIHLFSFE